MSTANLDSADLKAIEFGGLINEDVMQKIWDISNIPLPFTDMLGSDSVSNSYTEWTQDRLQDTDLTNAVVDGADIDQNDTNSGARVGNHCQISVKEVQVSTRANDSDSIGDAGKLAYQVSMRQKELRRDVEAITLSEQGSVADDGNTTAGQAAGFSPWLTTNTDNGVGGVNGGFSSGLTAAYTPGTLRGLTETQVRDMAQQIWELGGNPTQIMGVPSQIRRLSEYMFTSSARIATMDSDVGQNAGAKVAQGSVNVFVTDFGVTLKMVPNRLQPTYESAAGSPGDVANLMFLDTDLMMQGFLHGYRTEPLAKTGLSDKRLMAVDWTFKMLNEESQGIIRDLDYTEPVVG